MIIKCVRAFRFSVSSLIHWARITVTITLFLLIGTLAIVSTIIISIESGIGANIWDVIFTVFAGVTPEASAFELALSYTPLFLFLILFGNLVKEDLYLQPLYFLLRIGSRRAWWLGKVASLAVAAFCYYSLGMGVIFGLASRFLPFSSTWSSLILYPAQEQIEPVFISTGAFIFWALLLSTGTALGMVLLQWILSLVTGNSFFAVILTMFGLIISTKLGTLNANLVKWLPGTQSAILCHNYFNPAVPNFSLTWSLIYNFLWVTVCTVAGIWCLDRIDLYGNRADETN
jgi:hypothetical protein